VEGEFSEAGSHEQLGVRNEELGMEDLVCKHGLLPTRSDYKQQSLIPNS
jgi:hypothetical protein